MMSTRRHGWSRYWANIDWRYVAHSLYVLAGSVASAASAVGSFGSRSGQSQSLQSGKLVPLSYFIRMFPPILRRFSNEDVCAVPRCTATLY